MQMKHSRTATTSLDFRVLRNLRLAILMDCISKILSSEGAPDGWKCMILPMDFMIGHSAPVYDVM